MFNYGILITPTSVPELNRVDPLRVIIQGVLIVANSQVEITPEGINVGAAVSLTYLVQVLKEQVASRSVSWSMVIMSHLTLDIGTRVMVVQGID